MSDKFYVGLDITGFENTGKYRPISRVTLIIDDSASVTAGDDSGIEISAQCPHATQAMADALLAQMKGYQYQAFTADAANLDPAAELGDGITANGVYSTLSRIDDDGRGFPNISAPGEVAMEEEYPSAGPMTQKFNRQIAETRSQITKTADEIRLYVVNEIEGVESELRLTANSLTVQIQSVDGRVSTLSQTLDGFSIKVSDIDGRVGSLSLTVDKFETEVSGLNGAVTKIEQKVDGITLSAQTQGTSSKISLTSQGIEISSADITFQGLVTFEELGGSPGAGSTLINGAWLQTGTVSASFLSGEQILLRPANDWASGVIDITGASTSTSAIELRSFGALRLTGLNGDVFMQAKGMQYLHLVTGVASGTIPSVVVGNGSLLTNNPLAFSLGLPGQKWKTAYLAEPASIGSDAGMKHSVSYDTSKYDALFDLLKPVFYQYNHGESGRYHTGFIAQDVEEAVKNAGLESMDFAGYLKDQKTGEYSLRYEEFISLCVDQIQKLKQRMKKLEGIE